MHNMWYFKRCKIYVDIMRGEKFTSTRIYWSGRLSSRKGGDWVKEGDEGDRYFSPLQSSLHYRT